MTVIVQVPNCVPLEFEVKIRHRSTIIFSMLAALTQYVIVYLFIYLFIYSWFI
jgi:hypothetical protein